MASQVDDPSFKDIRAVVVHLEATYIAVWKILVERFSR